jgi:DNA-binding response OmpR family regulator
VLQWLERRESGTTSVAAVASAGGHLRRRKRVLLIEDSAHFQNLVRLLIAHEFPDVDLHVAEDGIIGLIKAGELQPDVLLVDLLLPGVDGATLVSRLRAYPLQRSHLIVVTSLDAEQRTPYAMALADVRVVHKPQLVEDLPGLLRACMV